MAVDQPVFALPLLNPLAGEIVEAFDVIHIPAGEKIMGISGRFNRHATAGNQIKMGGIRKGSQTRMQGVQCCLHEAPTTPGTFHPFLAKRRIWHIHQSAAYLSVSAVRAAFVKMYGDIIAGLS